MIVHWARPRLAGLEHEEVWVLCVNSHTALRSAWQVGKGGIHGCGLLARDILVPVVRDGASGFILVHNHPSGDPTPSSEDIDLTRGIQIAAMSLCIPLLDHVVVARGGARSFFELGYLDR
jgi:DNA repair protein RadC